ncbi:hypothetical protein DdX_21801 [Ditylenchus destructor]|uniref:Uncharacterized protein n=1 Tax=Ditylenchus destructor TaxID=166010 RepID=A0AAD4MEG1_9BILA|nr:hypothetical protein DdX_21801 [Ditylenchus destructor]
MNSSNQIPTEMEYVKYLNLGLDIAIAVLHVTTIFFTFHVIYCSKFDKKSTKIDRISKSFCIFLASRGIGAVMATPYPVYLAAYWSVEGSYAYVVCILANARQMPCINLFNSLQISYSKMVPMVYIGLPYLV